MGGIEQGHPEILQPPLHHAADVVDMDRPAGKPALLFERALEQRRILGRIAQARAVQIIGDDGFQVVAHRDLARLSAFFGEVEHPLPAGMVEILEPELGDGARARAGIDEHRKDGAVAQAHHTAAALNERGWVRTPIAGRGFR